MEKSCGGIRTGEELEFAVFCIENAAKELHRPPEEVYLALTEKSDILRGYLVPSYPALHTQGRDYILSELLEVMRERGVA